MSDDGDDFDGGFLDVASNSAAVPVAIGVGLCVLCCIGLIFLFLLRRRKKKQQAVSGGGQRDRSASGSLARTNDNNQVRMGVYAGAGVGDNSGRAAVYGSPGMPPTGQYQVNFFFCDVYFILFFFEKTI